MQKHGQQRNAKKGCELDVDAEVDVWNHEDKIGNENVTGSVKVAPVTNKTTEKRLKWLLRTCQEKGRGARTNKNVRCTSSRKEMDTKTEYQVERLV